MLIFLRVFALVLAAATVLLSLGASAQVYVEPAGNGQTPFRELNTDRPGADFLAFDLPPGDEAGSQRCSLACSDNRQCLAYTYVNPGVQGPNARCYLKSSVPPPQPSECCVSGAKTPGMVTATPVLADSLTNPVARRRIGLDRFTAVGVIPVVTVILEAPATNGRQDFTAAGYDAEYFNDMLFGPPGQTALELLRSLPLRLPDGSVLQQRNALRSSQHSVNSFIWEASNHRLWLVPVETIGPIRIAADADTFNTAARAVAASMGERLRLFDKNGDGDLTPNELTIMLFDNTSSGGAAANTASVNGECFDAPGSPVSLCGAIGGHGFASRVQNPVHEFAHVLGLNYDTYGWNPTTGGAACWGQDTTIMSCTAGNATVSNLRVMVDFDAFHRLLFGWATPQMLRFGQTGVFKLTPAQSLEDRPLVLHSPNFDEIFVVELRRGSLGGHDAGFSNGADGLMFWYAKLGENGPENRHSGIGPGRIPNGLQTTPLLDDVTWDWSNPPDGILDVIRPGPNVQMDTTEPGPGTNDQSGFTMMIMPSKRPRQVWLTGQTDSVSPVGTEGIRLRRWNDELLPFQIDVKPHPTDRDAVLVFVIPVAG